MHRVTLAALIALAALTAAPAASAEVGIGPPVEALVPLNTQLTTTVPTIVWLDDSRAWMNATVSATVVSAGREIASLGPFDVVATQRPQRLSMALSDAQLVTLAEVRRSQPRALATVTYTLKIPGGTYPATPQATTDTMSSTMTLHTPARPRHRTALTVSSQLVTGGREEALGAVSLRTPSSWPRTSQAGMAIATFGPVPVSAGCSASLMAQPLLAAVRDPRAYLDRIGGTGDTAASGPWYRLRTTDFWLWSATAAAVRRIAPHRYAGVRIDAVLDPGCPASASHEHGFDAALVAAVRSVGADVTLVPRPAGRG